MVSQQRINMCGMHRTTRQGSFAIHAHSVLLLAYILSKMLDVPVFYLYLTNAEDTIQMNNIWVAVERTDCDVVTAFDAIFRSICKQIKDGGINYKENVAAWNVADFSAMFFSALNWEFIGLIDMLQEISIFSFLKKKQNNEKANVFPPACCSYLH